MTEHAKSADQIEIEIDRTRAEMDETLSALRQKFSLAHLFDDMFGRVRDGGGEFAAGVGRTVRDNPVPVVLIGVGLGWLALSSTRSTEHEWDERDPRSDSATAHTDTAIGRVGDRVGSAGGSTIQSAQEGASDLGQRVKDKAAGVARELGSKAQEVGARAKALAEAPTAVGSRLVRRAGAFGQEHPLVIGALGFALGAAIAATLPMTRRENETLGESSDVAKKAARDAVREGARHAKGVATAAYEAAVDEAKDRDLTSETAKREAGRAAEAGAQVAKAGAQAAVSKIRSSTETRGGGPSGARRPEAKTEGAGRAHPSSRHTP